MRYLCRKLVSFTTMCAILIASTAILHADAATQTRSVEYYKIDYDNPTQKTSTYTLTLSERSMQTRATIDGVNGTDDRKPDTNSSVVRLSTYIPEPYVVNPWKGGTGFIVGEHTIATAAHCLYTQSARTPDWGSIYVYDAEKGTEIKCAIEEIHIPTAYMNERNHENDYALITVAEDLSKYGMFDLGIIDEDASAIHNIPITISGFPSKVLNENNQIIDGENQLYTGTGRLIRVEEEKLFYNTDASEGNSGSPVYVKSRYTINGAVTELSTVVGVCTGDSKLNPNSVNNTNDAKRFTETTLQFYLNNPNIGY